MFSKDISKMRYKDPRSLNDAYGPYAKLHIPVRKSRFESLGWILFYGSSIGLIWYGLLLWVTR